MLTKIVLSAFKNHVSGSFSWQQRNMIIGPNGSGKTNLLEAIYLLINGMPASGKTMTQCVNDRARIFSIGWGIMKWSLEYGCHLGCDTEEKIVRFSFQEKEMKRSTYLESMSDRAILFSPIEMNILYLGPSLRRDLLDESITLAFPSFVRVRRDYATALRNRNALLKAIRERRSSASELDAWDHLFSEHALRYYEYRMRLIRFIREHSDSIVSLLEWKYRIRFEYLSRLGECEALTHESILSCLRSERDHDVASGHTSVGPHLDDFAFIVTHSDGRKDRSSGYLSRGENKTILLGLKFLMIRFIESQGDKKTILLFDDLFSELDAEHTDLILSATENRQIFITSQNPAWFYPFCQDFHVIELH